VHLRDKEIVYTAISKCDRRKGGTAFAQTEPSERRKEGEVVHAVSRTFPHRPRRKMPKKGKVDMRGAVVVVAIAEHAEECARRIVERGRKDDRP